MNENKTSAESSNLKPIPRENAFLETFFCTLANFHFDRARESVEKEKEAFKPEIGSLWSGLLNSLSQLANIEKSYFTMMFVERRLLRRETIKPLYLTISSELKKIKNSVSISDALHGTEALSFDISKQLQEFITARVCMIDFYEFIAKSGWSNAQNKAELLKAITDIISKFGKDFHHPVLDALKTSFGLEVDIVHTLIQLEIQLAEWEFFESIILLHECQTKLKTWFILTPSLDPREQSFSYISFFRGNKKDPEVPFLYLWLLQYYELLVAKFAFYFYATLNSNTPLVEMKTLLNRASVDYVTKLQNFHKKTDALSISLVLDSNKKSNAYVGNGYHLKNIMRLPPTGMNSYPSIVNLPDKQPKEHWPNVISIINDNSHDLIINDKIVYFYDVKSESSYFLVKVDLLMTLVVIYNSKKKERDNHIINTLTEIKALLNHTKLYHMLKPGQPKTFLKLN